MDGHTPLKTVAWWSFTVLAILNLAPGAGFEDWPKMVKEKEGAGNIVPGRRYFNLFDPSIPCGPHQE